MAVTSLGFTEPAIGSLDWGTPLNSNWDTLDNYLTGVVHLSTLTYVTQVTQLTAQTASIGFTSLFSTTTAGQIYRVSATLTTTTAGTAGTATVSLYVRGFGQTSPGTALSVLGQTSSLVSTYFIVTSGDAIGYSTSLSGVTGSPQYRLDIVIERLK